MSMHIRTSEGSVSGWTQDNVKTIDFLITVAGKYGKEDAIYKGSTKYQTSRKNLNKKCKSTGTIWRRCIYVISMHRKNTKKNNHRWYD